MSTPENTPAAEPNPEQQGDAQPVAPAYAPPAYTPPPSYTPPPAYGAPAEPSAPGAYPADPSYGAAPAYGAPAAQPGAYPPPAYPAYPQAPQQQYAAPGGYAYGGPKTNVLAIISMIASILGAIWILPIIGSLGGAIMGHIALKQIAATGEKGRGMALAGVIVGWVGLGLFLVFGILAFSLFFAAVSQSTYY